MQRLTANVGMRSATGLSRPDFANALALLRSDFPYQKRDQHGTIVEGRVYIRNVLTHWDYDKGAWRNGCHC
jgi:hypothetical protein